MAYLLKTGHIWLIPGLFLQSASKYAGYFLGKRYKKLPEKMILILHHESGILEKEQIRAGHGFLKEISQFKHNSLLNCLL